MIREVANRYTILDLVGQGGMADVYKAYDTILSRIVAIKVLREKLADDPMTLVRFQREASAASKLSHPNIIDIYDVGEADGLHYIVMEFVRGRTLKQMLAKRGALPYEEAIFIMKQLTSAVSHAHRNHIIHRDIKPQNVLVKDDGTVKITDFGIALSRDAVQLTGNNAVMGSAHYLAPETTQGKEPDVKIDIYSLGIVFYELLTGDVPFKGKTPTEIAVKHLRQPMPSVKSFNPDIPQSVENIVYKASAKDCRERYDSANEMEVDLAHCLDPEYRNMPVLKLKTRTLDMEGNPAGQPEKPAVRTNARITWIYGIAAGALTVVLLFLAATLAGIFRFPGFLGYEQMPSLAGMSLEKARTVLEETGFAAADISTVQEVSDTVDPGDVVSQSVKAGSVVKGDTPVTLTLSKGPSFLVPDYTGRNVDEVKQELQQQGVHLQIQTEKKGAGDMEPDTILEQSVLLPGDRVDPDAGKTIQFVVSTYPGIDLSPDLVGMPLEQAKQWLNEQGIAVVTQSVQGGNTVLYTSPEVGSHYVQEGTDSVVTLYY